MSDPKQELLRNLPSVTELLKSETVAGWLRQHPLPLVTECLRRAIENLRRQILDDRGTGFQPVSVFFPAARRSVMNSPASGQRA